MTMEFSTSTGVADIDSKIWDGLANPAGQPFNPTVSHAFFAALEKSGSASRKSGWAPVHIVASSGQQIVGIIPCYAKSHSMGEYVFDHGWAVAFQRAGGRYYPKLQVSVPFTPVTGPRVFAREKSDVTRIAEALTGHCEALGCSSVHVTFASDGDVRTLDGLGWLKREDTQFHWFNNGYTDFSQFLSTLSASKRKHIAHERREVAAAGIEFELLTGKDLTELHWDKFFEFYLDTGSRKWGQRYLNRAFFSMLHEGLAENVLLILAKREKKYIAGALNFIGSDTLYGRNWGCIEQHNFLHFETCYYQAIDFAISRKLRVVEAGAQGEHKLSRGYLPVKMTSMHYFRHVGLRNAVAEYLAAERMAAESERAILSSHSPFRKDS
jgi:uncharacterized protein